MSDTVPLSDEPENYAELFLRAARAVESLPEHLRETAAHFVALRILRPAGERITTWRAPGTRKGDRTLVVMKEVL